MMDYETLLRQLEISRKLHSQEKFTNQVLLKKIRSLEKEIEQLKKDQEKAS